VINFNYSLFVCFFIALNTTSLRAMEPNAHNYSPNTQEKLGSSSKVFTLTFDGGAKIPNVPFRVLSQSKVLSDMIEDIGGLENAADNMELPLLCIDKDVMIDVVKYLEFSANCPQIAAESKKQAIANLKEQMRTKFVFSNISLMIECARVFDYLDCGLLAQAFRLLIAENLNKEDHKYVLNGDFALPAHIASIHKAYWISHQKAIDPKHPVKLSVLDLEEFGLVVSDIPEKDIAAMLTGILYQTIDADCLKEYLEFANSFHDLSIKIHKLIIDHLRALSAKQIKLFFDQTVNKSLLSIALQLVCAKDCGINLVPDLNCTRFLDHLAELAGGDYVQSELLSQDNLQFVLPLIEPLRRKAIKKINLVGKDLIQLPDTIGNLVNLESLLITKNRLTKLPDSLGRLVKLEELHLFSNELTEFPQCIGQLSNLKMLNLTSNKLVTIPDCISRLVNLKSLIISRNQLSAIPESISNLAKLKDLELYQNKLIEIPQSLGELAELRELNLQNNQLTTIPESFAKLTKLKRLNLENNQLTTIPESFAKLTKLKELDLGKNNFSQFPTCLGDLVKLEELYLFNNLFTTIPDIFGNLGELTNLDIEDNYFSPEIVQQAKEQFSHLENFSI